MLEKMLALQNKRKKEGGFTLVELIVVLVILAILAALLIPALTGYIDKAKEKGVISETRQCVMAAQTLADEEYAKGTTSIKENGNNSNCSVANIKDLAEVTGTVNTFQVTDGKVITLKYTAKNGKVCNYTKTPVNGKDSYEIEKATESK